MKNTTIKLLKENPEAFKEVAIDYGMYYCTHESLKDEKVWNSFLSKALKPYWEILEFRATKKYLVDSFSLINGEYVGWDSDEKRTLEYEELLIEVKSGGYAIHSVRRSDGEVFKEKDHTNQGIIERFFLGEFVEMVVECMGTAGLGAYPLTGLTKLQPLFITHDKVPVYEMDTVIPVYKKELKIFNEVSFTSNQNTDDFLYFSTRSAAEQWVEDNKPEPERKQVSVRDQLLAFFG